MINKQQTVRLAIFLLFAFLVTSCSFQKRVYMPGYHVTKINHVEHPGSGNKTHQANKDALAAKGDHQQSGSTEMMASTNKSIVLAKAPAVFAEQNAVDTCDIIILKKNAEELKGKVIEITATSIKYKKCDDPSGKVLLLKKSDVFMIKYPDGTKEVIKDSKTAEQKAQETHVQNNSGNGTFIEYEGDRKQNVLGMIGFILSLCSLLLPILSIGAVILCIIALIQISNHREKYKGKALAIVGLIIGALILAFYLILIKLIIGGGLF